MCAWQVSSIIGNKVATLANQENTENKKINWKHHKMRPINQWSSVNTQIVWKKNILSEIPMEVVKF